MKTLALIIPLLIGCAGTQAAPQSPTVVEGALVDRDFDGFLHGGDTPQPSPQPAPTPQQREDKAASGFIEGVVDQFFDSHEVDLTASFRKKGAPRLPTQVLPDSAAKEPSKPPVVKQNIEPPKAPPVEAATPAKLPVKKSVEPFAVVFGAKWCGPCQTLDGKIESESTETHVGDKDGIKYHRVRGCLFGLVDVDNDGITERRTDDKGIEWIRVRGTWLYRLPTVVYYDGDGKETSRTIEYGGDAAFERMVARHAKCGLTAEKKAAVMATASQPNVTSNVPPADWNSSPGFITPLYYETLSPGAPIANDHRIYGVGAPALYGQAGVGISVLGVPMVQGSAW